jgi:hypothetical protein
LTFRAVNLRWPLFVPLTSRWQCVAVPTLLSSVKTQIQVRNHTTFAPISAAHGNQSTSSNSSSRRPFASLLSLAMVLAMVGLSSCVGLTNAGPNAKKGKGGTGMLSASATSLSFGNVAVGNNKIQSVTITNNGTAAINLSQASATGAGYTVAGGIRRSRSRPGNLERFRSS